MWWLNTEWPNEVHSWRAREHEALDGGAWIDEGKEAQVSENT